MRNKVFISYVICLHILLITVLVKSDFIYKVRMRLQELPDEITQHYRIMVAFHSRVDKNLPSGAVYFIGDSHTQGLAVSAISPHAVNYGIGNDTTVGVIKRLPQYKSLSTAGAVVLAIGYNDLRRRNNKEIAENIEKILNYLPAQTTIILCALHPIGTKVNKSDSYTQRIMELNSSLEKISRNYINVTFVSAFEALSDKGNLISQYHLQDGVHLSKEGYAIWISKLANILKKISTL